MTLTIYVNKWITVTADSTHQTMKLDDISFPDPSMRKPGE
jgi:hypothetical protein